VRSVSFSQSNTFLASGGDDFSLIVWDLDSRKVLFSKDEHKKAVSRVKFPIDNKNLVATGCHDGLLRVYDIRDGKLIQLYEAHKDAVNDLDLHCSGLFMMSCSEDGTTRIWDLRKGLLSFELEEEGAVSACQFSKDGYSLATGSRCGLVRLFKSGFVMHEREVIEQNIELVSSK
jgi:WD40 repeat protein